MSTDQLDATNQTSRVAANAFSVLCLVGAAIIGYLALVSHASASSAFVNYSSSALALVITSALVFLRGAHISQHGLTVACLASTVGTTWAVAADYTNATALVMFFMWISLFAWYFLDAQHGMFINLLIVLCYMVLLTRLVAPARYPIHLLTMIGSLTAAGVIIEMGKRQVSRLLAQLERAAVTDPLTGLANRRSFEARSHSEMTRCERYGVVTSLLLLDIDHFKSINDTWGHHTGDEVLKFVAATLSKLTRDSDFAARIGGEEFVCMLPETNIEGAVVFADRIRDALRSHILEDGRLLTTSIGVSQYDMHGTTITQLLNAADTALYEAKENGRDRVVVAEQLPGTAGTG